ncbi:TRAP transporter small permease [Marinibacterium sp. SX1]|uniref:TRAP transporter small permease n=1 Tax=Marinibacterium sp. SX1 TaxID=3388424 RepID=UPI003D168750
MYVLLSRIAELIARGMAILGGLALMALVVMTCVSITGRALIPMGLQPVRGDFELVSIGMGFAVFAFLPWGIYARSHATVDLFLPVFPGWLNRVIDLLADLGFLAVAVIMAWRLWLGMLDKKSYYETTLILQFDMWQAYALALVGAVAFALVAGFCVLRSALALAGRDEEPAHV